MELKHYEVYTPDMVYYHVYGEPNEPWMRYGVYYAPNQRAAKERATADKDFKPWLEECRSDSVNPFAKLIVNLNRCEHGVCLTCDESCLNCQTMPWMEGCLTSPPTDKCVDIGA